MGLMPFSFCQLTDSISGEGQHRSTWAAVPAHNRRSTLLSSRCVTPMELTAIWHLVISIPSCFSSTPKNISFLTIISWFCIVTLRLCGLRHSSAILAALKNFDWHWHWQCRKSINWLTTPNQSARNIQNGSNMQRTDMACMAELTAM